MRERGYGWKQAQTRSLRIHRTGSEEQTKMHKNISTPADFFHVFRLFYKKKPNHLSRHHEVTGIIYLQLQADTQRLVT